ncbi:hypothetical protein ABPG75_008577 [Micractinium tetrahymenae]
MLVTRAAGPNCRSKPVRGRSCDSSSSLPCSPLAALTCPMLLAARRAAVSAATARAPLAAAAAPLAASRSLAIVAGQDTPVSKEDLPEHIKAHNVVTQAPGSGKGPSGGGGEGQERSATTGGGASAAAASAGQERRSHPGPESDPYSGGDPSQEEEAGNSKG